MAQSTLHPGSQWIFRARAYVSSIVLLIFLSFFGGSILSGDGMLWKVVGIILLFLLLLLVVCAEIYARLSYRFWRYEFTPTNLRLERGIIWKQYSNIPYERVQNVDIRRGIFARIFGFSEVYIQTAGYSAVANGYGITEGYIPGVDVAEAEKIRDFLMKKISKRAKSGL
jgi:uncharacterized protein